MIEIHVPKNASYDELVLRTITNITIKQLCHYSDILEDLIQAYDLKEKRINRKKITIADENSIRSLESKYNATIYTLATVYEDYYQYLALVETESMGKMFKHIYKSMLNKLDTMMITYGISL